MVAAPSGVSAGAFGFGVFSGSSRLSCRTGLRVDLTTDVPGEGTRDPLCSVCCEMLGGHACCLARSWRRVGNRRMRGCRSRSKGSLGPSGSNVRVAAASWSRQVRMQREGSKKEHPVASSCASRQRLTRRRGVLSSWARRSGSSAPAPGASLFSSAIRRDQLNFAALHESDPTYGVPKL